ncbi:hypothetical protein Trco_008057 [Trichoderma cornu-damae]|uniref:Uncharacterized protein n=1 Tax=Trichoderma cornu-damae TaxID=654480 RepID=A0A9P8QJ39_9HYPO|nr:hypothetical protein Trco_008057 [Trichoderma cornu-damae]
MLGILLAWTARHRCPSAARPRAQSFSPRPARRAMAARPRFFMRMAAQLHLQRQRQRQQQQHHQHQQQQKRSATDLPKLPGPQSVVVALPPVGHV